jgi:glycosyltransferase involved in cell wall biosynthesis
MTPPVAFCGSAGDEIRLKNYVELMREARELGVEHQIYSIGYVGDDEMSALYHDALALVMPTYFGPTNIPVLEAWQCGCPVLTSDIRGIREQVGDAALRANPNSADAIADGIARIITDSGLRSLLIAQGYARLASYSPAEYARRFAGVLESVASEPPHNSVTLSSLATTELVAIASVVGGLQGVV